MGIDEAYLNYQADVSGARSKNRFSFEIYWGIDKFLHELAIHLISQWFLIMFVILK